MQLILDSNEYIFALGDPEGSPSRTFLDVILDTFPKHRIRITRMIVEEVKRNLVPEAFREFVELISQLTTIDEDIFVPFELGAKYESKGFKPADAFIAAYAEWTGADALVTENRHFLSHRTDLSFRVLTAERCLKLIKP